jgi:hypothetical protein
MIIFFDTISLKNYKNAYNLSQNAYDWLTNAYVKGFWL